VQRVPFGYLHSLVGAFHKWLGPSDIHDSISLYSLSWLTGGRASKPDQGLYFASGARWMISAHDDSILERVAEGIQRDPEVCCGMRVLEVREQRTPDFGSYYAFKPGSPILAKGDKIEGRVKHWLFQDVEADEVLTKALRHKMDKAGLGAEHKRVSVRFDRSSQNAKTKMMSVKGVQNKASLCPVIVEGTPQAVQFAWNVGAGHLTGSGFGCLQ
jgi:CRISPR-associated endoribonuclease Cas6